MLDPPGPLAVFTCLPHGKTATKLGELMGKAEERGCELRLVDLSADFRLPSRERSK